MDLTLPRPQLRAGMVGMGMIFDDTYRPFFESVHAKGLCDRRFGDVDVPLVAVASKTGQRAEKYLAQSAGHIPPFRSFSGDEAVSQMLKENLSFACVATPDDRHFEAAKSILEAGQDGGGCAQPQWIPR